jgi:hypothetical protein
VDDVKVGGVCKWMVVDAGRFVGNFCPKEGKDDFYTAA